MEVPHVWNFFGEQEMLVLVNALLNEVWWFFVVIIFEVIIFKVMNGGLFQLCDVEGKDVAVISNFGFSV